MLYTLQARHPCMVRSFQSFDLLFFPFALFGCLYYIVSNLHGFSFQNIARENISSAENYLL